MTLEGNISARDAILRSIREHLAASTRHDGIRTESSEQKAHAEPAKRRRGLAGSNYLRFAKYFVACPAHRPVERSHARAFD